MPGHTPNERSKRKSGNRSARANEVAQGGFTPRPLPNGDGNERRRRRSKRRNPRDAARGRPI